MAVPATWLVELRSTGLDANGGAYNSGGTDYSQQDAAQLTLTDVISAGSTTLTSVVGGFTSAMIGNSINIVGIGFRRVATRVDTNTITVDASVAAATYTASVGGALLTPGMAAQVSNLTSGISVHQKSGTYTITSATPNIAGGCVSLTGAGFWWGFNSTRGDNGTRPTIVADGAITSFTLWTAASNPYRLENVIFDGNSRTTSTGVLLNQRQSGYRLHVKNTTVVGLDTTANANGGLFWNCSATTCSGTAAIRLNNGCFGSGLEAYANTTVGILLASASVSFSLSYLNTGASSDGFQCSGLNGLVQSCSAGSNGRHNFNNTGITATVTQLWLNCASEAAAGYGFTSTGAVATNLTLVNCADYNSASGARNLTQLPLAMVNFITLSAAPFVDSANGNFALNTTAGGGASLRAVGFPGTLPRGTAVGYQDIGAVQHADPAGGGAIFARIRTGM